MDERRWITPPAVGTAWRWRERRRHGIEFTAIWLGTWHNPGAGTHHALWRLPSGDERFAETMLEWAEPIGALAGG